MTRKTDFSPEEWETVVQGPPTAGMIVLTAQRGGTFRETLSIAKAYAEARKEHGQSELLDEIVSSKPELDRTRYHSFEELRENGLQHLRSAVELLEQKATADEVRAYKQFVLDLAARVASAHREGAKSISDAEQAALDELAATLGTSPSSSWV